jgi:hypothetical protein
MKEHQKPYLRWLIQQHLVRGEHGKEYLDGLEGGLAVNGRDSIAPEDFAALRKEEEARK